MRWLNILHAYQPPDWDRRVIERVVRESYWPLTVFLRDHPTVKLTLNIAGSLTEQLASHGHRQVLHGLKLLVERGQVELTTMPKYHPLLPLLTDEEVTTQIEANQAANRRAFGAVYQPRGLFPPELAIDARTGPQAHAFGLSWLVADELALTGRFGERLPTGTSWTGTDVRVLFRHRQLSDLLAFELQLSHVTEFVRRLPEFGLQDDILITAMDAENLGHHRPGAEAAWQALVTQPNVETLTVSEFLRFSVKPQSIIPRPTSWATDDHDLAKGVPYPLWQNPENPIHQALHRLADKARETLLVHRHHRGYTEARQRLDRAQASDVFWWASMRPWWDAPIVLREAAEFARALDPLDLKPNPLETAWLEVERTVQEWEQTGRAAGARAKYLDEHRAPRFFGGQHVT